MTLTKFGLLKLVLPQRLLLKQELTVKRLLQLELPIRERQQLFGIEKQANQYITQLYGKTVELQNIVTN